MLYDLNIAWSASTSAAELERTLKFSKTLGYDVVALNHTINAPIPAQIVNPLPKFPPPPPPPNNNTTTNKNQNNLLPTALHRATLILSDPNIAHRLPQLATSYDILAVRPTSEREFQAACLNVAEASLISLDLTQRFPFHFRPKPCMAAVNRGLRFEVCYSPSLLLRPSSSAATFMGNVVELVRATRGRGIVISSGAGGVLGLRAPADVVNLFAVWGLGAERGMEGLGVLPRGVVVNEGVKRSGFRGVVDIVGVAERDDEEEEEERLQLLKQGQGQGQKQKQKGANTNNNSNKNKNNDGNKRKKGQESSGGGGGDGPEGDDKPMMSKRQAKKMKRAPAAVVEKDA